MNVSRQDRIREAYGRAVGDHDYLTRHIKDLKDYHSINDLLPIIRSAVPDVTLDEVCAVRWEDEKLYWCPNEIEIEHASWCLQVPNGYPNDPDLIGPFDTYEDAKAFTETDPRDAGRPPFDAWQHLPSNFSASTSSRLIGRASPASANRCAEAASGAAERDRRSSEVAGM